MKNIAKNIALAVIATAFAFAGPATPSASAGTVDRDRLYEGQAMNYTIYLHAGQSVAYAVEADSDCFDVDLIALTPSGRRIAADTLTDAYPVIRFTAPCSGNYTIRVAMIDTFNGIWSEYRLIEG